MLIWKTTFQGFHIIINEIVSKKNINMHDFQTLKLQHLNSLILKKY